MSSAAKSAAHIVLVEDNAGDAYLLEKALEARHIVYTLTRYEDGEQGIRELSSDHAPIPNLILLDLNVPRREGFDVLRAVRTRPALVGGSVAPRFSSGKYAMPNVAREPSEPAGHAILALLQFLNEFNSSEHDSGILERLEAQHG